MQRTLDQENKLLKKKKGPSPPRNTFVSGALSLKDSFSSR